MNNNFCPSQEALNLLRLYIDPHEKVITLARLGHHVQNPYHNLIHELQHVYWAYACAVHQDMPGMTGTERNTLLLASLFHDHNHSGGRQKDSENIFNALKVNSELSRILPHIVGRGSTTYCTETWSQLIKVTQFNGSSGFECEPQTVLEMAMRDADLMAIYSEEGRTLLVGLAEEMGKPYHAMKTSERQEALDRNAEFLRNAPMYTTYGQRMKALYLEKSLKQFAQLVKGIRDDMPNLPRLGVQ